MKFLLLILGLILISQFPFRTNAKTAHEMIDEICNTNDFKPENTKNCINILNANPKVLRATTYFEFAKAILELAIKKGIEGQNFLKNLSRTKHSSAIEQCAGGYYGSLIGSLQSAKGELKESPSTSGYDAAVAADGPQACETALADEHIVEPAITALNKYSILLSTIASTATDKLQDP